MDASPAGGRAYLNRENRLELEPRGRSTAVSYNLSVVRKEALQRPQFSCSSSLRGIRLLGSAASCAVCGLLRSGVSVG